MTTCMGLPRLLVLIAALFVAGEGWSQDVKVTLQADSTQYRIGDWIFLTITVEAPAAVHSLRPLLGDSLGQFEIMKVEQRGPSSWRLQVTTFDTGRVVIPPVEVAYRVDSDTLQRRASSNILFLPVFAPTVNPQEDLRDIKPPLDAPWLFEDFQPYLIALVLIGAACAAYLYWRTKRRAHRDEAIVVTPAVAPHTLALMQLRELEEKRLWQQGRVKEYYSEVTEIIRRFLEGRFGIPALELTSDEVLQRLNVFDEADPVVKQLQLFLTTADLVKFARYEPTPAENGDELSIAYEIVRSLIPKPVVQPSVVEESADVR
jgi:hypothetical protein